MTITAWEAAALKWEANYGLRHSPYRTPGELAKSLDPATQQTPALDLIDATLVEVADGSCDRLIICMAPQEGKSERVSRRTPLWMLTRNPNLRIAIASYEHGVARRWGRAIRNDIAEHPELGLAVRPDTSAAHEWQLDGYRGGVYCVGIGGALTGRPVDCFVGSTRIVTEHGYTSMRDLYQSAIPPRVLTLNHETGQPEWRRIVARRAIPNREVIEVVTAAGRRFTCTPDHRIHTEDGYREAALLRPGDRLTVGWAEHTQGVHGMRQGSQEPWRNLPGLLSSSEGIHMADAPLHSLRGRVPAHARGAREEAPARSGQQVLLSSVRSEGAQECRPTVQEVRETYREQGPQPPVLLDGMPEGQPSPTEDQGMSSVRCGVQLQQHAAGVLHQEMRERRALDPHGRDGQLAPQGRHKLRRMVPADAPAHHGAGREQVQGVPQPRQAVPGEDAIRPDDDAQQPARAPHQRAAVGQPAGEPDPVVQDLSCRAPQVGYDTVSLVRPLRGERHTVYDLQVDGNHNFFAEEVLAHNCLLLDDPIKDRRQADSLTYRENVWEWWTNVGRTRLAPDAPVVLILTRWHEDDLAGRLLAEEGGRWRLLNIPALADHNPEAGETDPLGREPGEWMRSARGRTVAQWEQIRTEVGSRVFNALYQGRPSPDVGNVWQRGWWRRYSTPLWSQHPTIADAYRVEGCDEIVMSWDMAFKDTKSSDFVVGQVWARRGANVYLLDQVHRRLSFTDTVTAFKALAARWPQATAKYVEDKANGTAIIDTLKSKIPGIVAVTPTESKYARANAVAPIVEAGNAFLPVSEIALFDPDELIDEAAAFPHGGHDDQVDATSQALAQMLLDGTGAQAWIDYARRKAEAFAKPSEPAEPAPVEESPAPAALDIPDDPVAARKRARDAAFRGHQLR